MKLISKFAAIIVIAASSIFYSSCHKKQNIEPSVSVFLGSCTQQVDMGLKRTNSISTSPYNVHLSDLDKEGENYVWIWEIKNTNPGDGSNGTVPDLMHWGIDLGTCITLNDIVEAAYSTDKIHWTTFTPTFEADNSQNCSSNKYLQFNLGTSGSQPSYYKLVITKNIPHTNTQALYKSGTNCGVFITCGFGCTSDNSPSVDLKTACDFSILAESGISTTGTTSITGDIGVSPIAATAITGFGLIPDPSGQFSITPMVIGKVYAANYEIPTPAKMTAAIGDMESAYTALNNFVEPPANVELYGGDISGKTLASGNYRWSTGVLISDAGVTLNGGPNDKWIFQVTGDLTVNNNAVINLTGGAQAKNVFWVVAGQATLGTNINFKGTILSKTLISTESGDIITGKLLAQTAVTLISTTVIPTSCPQ